MAILDVRGDDAETCSLALLDAAAAIGGEILALRDITHARAGAVLDPWRADA